MVPGVSVLRRGFAAISLFGLPVSAQAEVGIDDELVRNEPAYLSSSFLDPLNRTRAHVTTRVGFFDQQVPDVGSRDHVNGSVEIQFVLRGTESFSVSTIIPVGWEATDGFDAIALYGNTKVGFNFGGEVQLPDLQPVDSVRPVPKIGLGGALELYLPTALDPQRSDCGPGRSQCAPMRNLRQFRALEPELWTNDAFLVRGRWHGDFRFDIVQAELELGLSPGVTIEGSGDFVLLANWAFRLAALPIPELELFAEIGASYGLVVPDDRLFPRFPGGEEAAEDAGVTDFGDLNDLDTPVRLTFGARLHLASASFDPALFVSVGLEEGLVMAGLDLAGMLRSRPGARQRRERRARDPLDF